MTETQEILIMTDTLERTSPPIGENLTLSTAALAREGDLVSLTSRGLTYFGEIKKIVLQPGGAGGYISGGGVSGPVTLFVYHGRPGRNGWVRFTGDKNPIGGAIVEARLVTGKVIRQPANAFPDVAWSNLITHIRPYVAPPTPTTETVEKVLAALSVFAAAADCYGPQEDDSFQIWLDRGVPGAPEPEVFQLKAYRAAKEAMELLMGPELLKRGADAPL